MVIPHLLMYNSSYFKDYLFFPPRSFFNSIIARWLATGWLSRLAFLSIFFWMNLVIYNLYRFIAMSNQYTSIRRCVLEVCTTTPNTRRFFEHLSQCHLAKGDSLTIDHSWCNKNSTGVAACFDCNRIFLVRRDSINTAWMENEFAPCSVHSEYRSTRIKWQGRLNNATNENLASDSKQSPKNGNLMEDHVSNN